MNFQSGSHARNGGISYQSHCFSYLNSGLAGVRYPRRRVQSVVPIRVRESRGYPEPNLTPAVPRTRFHGSGFLGGLAPGRCYRRRECPRSTPLTASLIPELAIAKRFPCQAANPSRASRDVGVVCRCLLTHPQPLGSSRSAGGLLLIEQVAGRLPGIPNVSRWSAMHEWPFLESTCTSPVELLEARRTRPKASGSFDAKAPGPDSELQKAGRSHGALPPVQGSAQPSLLHTPGFWVLQRRTTPADATDCRVSDSQLTSCLVRILFFGDSFNSKVSPPAWLSWPERVLSLLPGQLVPGARTVAVYATCPISVVGGFSAVWGMDHALYIGTEQESIDRCLGGLVPTKRR